MSKPVELYKDNASGRCSADVYRNGERLTDLRTLIDFDKLKARLGLRSEQNYADEKVTALQRLARYKGCNDGFDLDCCKTSAKYYHFQPVQDMYEVLWPVDEYPRDIVDSAETLVSANAALWRCKTENQSYIKRGKIDWDSLCVEASELEYDDEINDLNDFAHAVATIGNFMPVPCGHQFVLSGLSESYDQVLDRILLYYSCSSHKDEELFPQLFIEKRKHQWPAFRGWLGYFDGWNEFVEKSYLKGSFVDDDYRIVPFNSTFSQLTEMLENRSRVMLKEYGKRLGDLRRSTTV